MSPAHESFRRIGNTLGSVTSGVGAPPSGGGQFVFHPDQIRAIVKDWTDLAEDYRESLQGAQAMARIQPPGVEYSSEAHASVANSAGQAYLTSLGEKVNYCLDQANKFQKALDDYLGVEHHALSRINQAGEQHTERRGGL